MHGGFTLCFFFFSSRRRHTRFDCDWSSDVCSSDLMTSLRVLLLVTLEVLPIQPAGAQGTQPLRKAELVRMLARRALSKPQIATLVRRNCVTFQPTAHDRAELRAAGADDAVLAAIDQCLRARLARAAPPPRPRPVAPAPARPAPSPVVAAARPSARRGA